MKHLYHLLLLAFLSSTASLTAQNLYIRYDKNCMNNLQYQHNDNAGNTNPIVMFRISKSANEHYQLMAGEGYKKLKKIPKDIVSCNDITLNESFVMAINSGEKKVFMVTGGSDAKDIFAIPVDRASLYYFEKNLLKTTGIGYNFSYDFEQPSTTNLALPYSESIVLAAGSSMIYGKTAYTFQSTPLQDPTTTYTFNYIPAFGLVTQSNATSSLLLIKVNNADASEFMNTLGEYYPPTTGVQIQASTIQTPPTTITDPISSNSTYYPTTTTTQYNTPISYGTYTTSSEVTTVPPIYGGEKVMGEGGVILGVTYDYPLSTVTSSSTTVVLADVTPTVNTTNTTVQSQPTIDLMTSDYQDYVIQVGDNLTNIARRYRVSVNELKVWNGFSDDKIFVGQKIVVSDPYKSDKKSKDSDLIASKGSDDKSTDDYKDMPMPAAQRLGDDYVPPYRRTEVAQPESYNTKTVPCPIVVKKVETAKPKTYEAKVKPKPTTAPKKQAVATVPQSYSTKSKPCPCPTVIGKGTATTVEGNYTVQQGETIYSLSRRFGITQEEFRTLNGLGESDLLKVGQVVIVNNMTSSTTTTTSDLTPKGYDAVVRPSGSSQSANGRQYYEVQPDETVSMVARKFGMTVERLRSLNNMTDNEIAVPYQRLMVE